MGSNCVPLVEDFFLFCYDGHCMLSLSDLLHDVLMYLLNISNPYFQQMVSQIYP